jgi:hypothetical protein
MARRASPLDPGPKDIPGSAAEREAVLRALIAADLQALSAGWCDSTGAPRRRRRNRLSNASR